MQKHDTVYLGHMLDMARKIAVRVAGVSREDYDADEDLRFTAGAPGGPVEEHHRYPSPHCP